MDKLSTLVSLNELKTKIDELIERSKKNEPEESDSRKLLIMALAIIGGLVVIALIALAVYRHFSEDYLDDYEDLDDVFEDEEDEYEDEEDEDEDEEEDEEETVYDDDFDE